jgi:hypothetical protein
VYDHLLSAAPVLLGRAVRPPLTVLTALIGLGGLGLGAWLVWIGVFFDRPTGAPGTRPLPPQRPGPKAESPTAPDRTEAVV